MLSIKQQVRARWSLHLYVLSGFLKRPTDQPLRAANASNIPSKPERPRAVSIGKIDIARLDSNHKMHKWEDLVTKIGV